MTKSKNKNLHALTKSAQDFKQAMNYYFFQPIVQTKWLGQTNFRPSRIKAWNVSDGKYVTVSWDHALNVAENHLAAAKKLYALMGYASPDALQYLMAGTKDQKGYIITADLRGYNPSW